MTSETDKVLMDRYGITAVAKTIYFYKEYRYDNLSDALRYARTDIDKTGEDALPRMSIADTKRTGGERLPHRLESLRNYEANMAKQEISPVKR